MDRTLPQHDTNPPLARRFYRAPPPQVQNPAGLGRETCPTRANSTGISWKPARRRSRIPSLAQVPIIASPHHSTPPQPSKQPKASTPPPFALTPGPSERRPPNPSRPTSASRRRSTKMAARGLRGVRDDLSELGRHLLDISCFLHPLLNPAHTDSPPSTPTHRRARARSPSPRPHRLAASSSTSIGEGGGGEGKHLGEGREARMGGRRWRCSSWASRSSAASRTAGPRARARRGEHGHGRVEASTGASRRARARRGGHGAGGGGVPPAAVVREVGRGRRMRKRRRKRRRRGRFLDKVPYSVAHPPSGAPQN